MVLFSAVIQFHVHLAPFAFIWSRLERHDNVNLYLAHLLSRIYEVPEIVVRFDDPKYEELIKDLPGVKAVYPFQLSFEKILSCKEEMEAGK